MTVKLLLFRWIGRRRETGGQAGNIVPWKAGRLEEEKKAPYEIRTLLILCRPLAGGRVNGKLELLLHSTGMRWKPIADG